MLEYVAQADSDVEMSVLYIPLVIVLTQDCDLAQDQRRKVFAGRFQRQS
jgi:hypothetical protein